MKFLRLLLIWTLSLLLLAVIVVGIALSPILQTWGLQYALGHGHPLHGKVDSIYAGPSTVAITKLEVTHGHAALTLPRLDAQVSIWQSLWRRQILIKSLVARGWVLDLSHQPAPAPAIASDDSDPAAVPVSSAPTEPARPLTETEVRTATLQAAHAVYAMLRDYRLPAALSIDGLDLSGQVLVPLAPDSAPVRVDVTVQGGGLTATHSGDFAVTADAADMQLASVSIALDGHLTVTMQSPRAFDRFQIDATVRTGDQGEKAPWSVLAAVARAPVGARGSLEVRRGSQIVVASHADFSAATHRWSGTWQSDLTADELKTIWPDHPLPFASLTSDGRLDADAIFSEIKLAGRATALTRPDVPWFAGWAGPPEPVHLTATFNGLYRGHTLRLDTAQLALTVRDIRAQVTARQSFRIDEPTGQVTPLDPAADWLQVSLQAVPLAWARGFTGLFDFTGGGLSGEFAVQKTADGWTVHQPTPLLARDVTVTADGHPLARGFDLAVSFQAGAKDGHWQVKAAPLTVHHDGTQLAEITVDATPPPQAGEPVKLTGTWQADLNAAGWSRIIPLLARAHPRGTATGDLSGSLGSTTNLEGKFLVTGRNPQHTIAGSYNLTEYQEGAGAINLPLKLNLGTNPTDLTANLSWNSYDSRPLQLDVTGIHVDLAPLLRLARAAGLGPVLSLAREATGQAIALPTRPSRDQTPFWGQLAGRINVQLTELHALGRDFSDVGGTVLVDRHALKLEGGHAARGRHPIEPVTATITFDPAADTPYAVQANASLKGVDAAMFFGHAATVYQQQVEGRFDVTASAAGRGSNLRDLAAHLREDFKLEGTNGLTRLLQTNVAQVLPRPPESSKTVDTLVGMGSAVGRFFGAHDPLHYTETKLSPHKEAVLDLDAVLGVVGYDTFTIEGTRQSDGSVTRSTIEMIGPEVHLTGSGEVGHTPGKPWLEQPFNAELQLAVKKNLATYLTTAGLLSTKKDDLGYALLPGPAHWGGTVGAIDPTAWRELLAQAAQRAPAKKETPAAKAPGHP